MQFVQADAHGLRRIQRIGGWISEDDLRSLLSPWRDGFNANNHGKQSVLLKFLMTYLCLLHAGRSILDAGKCDAFRNQIASTDRRMPSNKFH
jgi:hypothetical protein